MKITFVLGLLVLAVLISGCIYKPETAPQMTQTLTTQPAVAVEIKDFKFNPASITVPRGTSVIWTQFDSAPHTVTSVTSKVLDSPVLRIKQTYNHTFNETGIFDYYCTIHPSMKGTVIVT